MPRGLELAARPRDNDVYALSVRQSWTLPPTFASKMTRYRAYITVVFTLLYATLEPKEPSLIKTPRRDSLRSVTNPFVHQDLSQNLAGDSTDFYAAQLNFLSTLV